MLEAGKRYRLNNGMEVGPMLEEQDKAGEPDRFYVNERIDDYFPMWMEDGKSTFFSEDGDEDPRYHIKEEIE